MNVLSRKLPTMLGLLILMTVVGGALYYLRFKQVPVSPAILPQKVTITNIADNKFSVSWVTQSATTGSVEYGSIGETLSLKASDERDSVGKIGSYVTHHVTITDLQPNTQYAFRILSGPKPTRFDNSGSPYTTTTGPVIGATPTSHNFYGTVELPLKQSPDGAIVYVSLPGSGVASTLVHDSGSYGVTISTMRTSDQRSYITYDVAATVATVTVESGTERSVATVSLANSTPVPTITLGEDADFRNQAQVPAVAQVVPAESSTPSAQTPSIFNVEPLSGSDINAVTTQTVTILNPKVEGETLATLRPEFRGTGPAGMTLSIALKGQKAISDTIVIAADGTWSWAPMSDLKIGKQTITVSYIGNGGISQKVERVFTITTKSSTTDPAFVSSPSASTKATPTPTIAPTPRAAMPATDSGVPVTGVIESTLLTAGLSLVIMIVGAFLLAL